MSLPPHVDASNRIVMFDGVCKLCHGWSRFLIRFDRQRQFRLCTVQSPAGQDLLRWAGLPTDQFDTMVYIEDGRIYTKSDAFLKVIGRMDYPFRLAALGWLLPRALRDWLYDRVAQNRYRIFGRFDVCLLPTPDHEARFVQPSH